MGAATKSSEVEMSSLSVSPRVPRIFLLLLLLAKSSLQAEGSSCNLTLTPDPRSQNVVSTQLEGSWVIDDELTERLWPIYMAGYFSDRENEEPWTTYPMVLTTLHGNPK